jgi:hypothetical protein
MRLSNLAGGATLICLIAAAATEYKPREFKPSERSYWAYQKVVKPRVPAVKNRAAVRNPIDAFLQAKLEEKGVRPNPPADKVTLIRRATLDLHGLPPTAEEVQAFLNDQSPDAFAKVVDRLLASPRYGERWARHWLDLARYADTAGFKGDETRPFVWRYRDYVIESLNQDKPYDRFIQEQIAGDELYPDDAAARTATAFNRHWADESNLANPILRRQEILNDITDTTTSVFLGLTVGCARCHDHKFDAILQKDYYRFQAFFANSRNEDSMSLLTGPDARAYEERYAAWDAKTREIRAGIEAILGPLRLEKLKTSAAMYPKEAQEALLIPPEQRTPMQWQMYYRGRERVTPKDEQLAKSLQGEAKERYEALAKELAQFDHLKPAEPPVTHAMIDAGREAPPTHILSVGIYDSPMDEVEPGFLSILDPAPAKIVPPPPGVNSTGRRSALAKWLASPENPLTARVMVNRVWHYHFGRGIVGSPSDFGVMGERPTNQPLLDYLAATFVENGWSIKKMHRLIMLSDAYRRASTHNPVAAKADPGNKLSWRFERRRLEGEVLRDSMLAVSGLLNLKMGGPGVFPPLPPGVSMPGSKYLNWETEKDPAEANRRSVYVFVKRNLRYPMFETFDFPDTHESCARRYTTITPTQSLALLNDELVLSWSVALAGRILNDAGLPAEAQVDRAYRLVHHRAPKLTERSAILEFLQTQASVLREQMARNEKVRVPESLPEGVDRAHAAAFVDFCHTLLNSNEFAYLN